MQKTFLTVSAIALLSLSGASAFAEDHSHEGHHSHEAHKTEAAEKVEMTKEAVQAERAHATAELINNDGEVIGNAEFIEGTTGILIKIDARDLPPGPHGMHLHATGDCSDHHHFHAAQGHIMEDGKPHGFLNPEGPHAGNLPNLIVHEDGTVKVEFYTELLQLNSGDTPVLDEDGATLIVHANEDDHFTQPIGGAGDRIACGVVKAK